MARNKENIAVFLDRDGTINRFVSYLDDYRKFQLYKAAGKAIRKLNKNRIKVIVITNQAGIGRGYFGVKTVDRIHAEMKKQLKACGASLDGVYYCPHHSECGIGKYKRDCDCRKPNTGLMEKAGKKYEIDINNSFMIGDGVLDIQMAKRAGCKSILVLTGYGRKTLMELKKKRIKPDKVVKNLFQAVNWIVNEY